jgi:hypothetical protein
LGPSGWMEIFMFLSSNTRLEGGPRATHGRGPLMA